MDEQEVSDESRLMAEYEPENKHVRSRKAWSSCVCVRIACLVTFTIAILACTALVVLYTCWTKHHAHSTDATVSGYENITERVLRYIDEDKCHKIFNSECGDKAGSYYNEFIYKGRRVVIFTQIPDHPAEQDSPTPNPNTRCERWQFVTMPINVVKSNKSVETLMDSVGVAVTGSAFFNYMSSPDGNLAIQVEGATLDSCGGHSAPGGRYHYHGNILCTSSPSAIGSMNREVCKHLGWYFDGVPVYGLCNNKGKPMKPCYRLKPGAKTATVITYHGNFTSGVKKYDYEFVQEDFDTGKCNLDEASGAIHPITGKYSYFATEEYPWVPSFYYGNVGTNFKTCSAN